MLLMLGAKGDWVAIRWPWPGAVRYYLYALVPENLTVFVTFFTIFVFFFQVVTKILCLSRPFRAQVF